MIQTKRAYEQPEPILKKAKRHRVTLVYGAKDTEHNNAEALKQYLVHAEI